jgi:hypothetical protein
LGFSAPPKGVENPRKYAKFRSGLGFFVGGCLVEKSQKSPARVEIERGKMIDAREEVSSSATQQQHRRRPTSAATGRSAKSSAASNSKSLRMERIFSDAKVKPFDQIEWERRTA